MGNTFTTDRYSNLTFKAFPGNWTEFSNFSFKIFNEGTNNQTLNLRIDDQQHRNSNSDHINRFNQTINLEPGWNKVSIDLNFVRVQPEIKNMDMSNIEKIVIYSRNLPVNSRLYFDDFKLQKSKP